MNGEKVDSCIVIVKNTNSEQIDWDKLVGKLKPGSHLVAICPLLQQHRVTAAIEDCVIEIRDCVLFLGNPSLMVSLGRVPLEGTVAENVLRHGVGGINIDGTRVSAEPRRMTKFNVKGHSGCFTTPGGVTSQSGRDYEARVGMEGRWPANVIVQDDKGIRAKFPFSKSCNSPSSAKPESKYRPGQGNYQPQGRIYPGDSGSAARFFHSVPCEDSLKELTLYLARLITPSGGKVLVYNLPPPAIIALMGIGFVVNGCGENEI